MMMRTTTLATALPLCCLFLAAADPGGCTIHIVTDNGEGEGEGAKEGEGEGGAVDGECQVDSDCGPDQACVFQASCPPCADPNSGGVQCEVACVEQGFCVDNVPPPPGCTSDADCGDGSFCSFGDPTTGAGQDPNQPQPPSGGGNDQPVFQGKCEPLPQPADCFSDVDCQPGETCVFPDATNGGGAPGPHSPVAQQSGICEPNQDPCTALCGPGSQCVIDAAGNISCQPIDPPPPPAECASDSDCQNGATCNAADVCLPDPSCQPGCGNGGTDPTQPAPVCTNVCWGYCVDNTPPPASCTADSDCAQGQVCEVTTSCPPCVNADPACEMPCAIDGKCIDANAGVPPQP